MKLKHLVISLFAMAISAVILTAGPAMDMNYLTKGPFKTSREPGWKFPDWGYEIVFQKNGTYSLSSSHNGGMFKDQGTFSVNGNAVTLKQTRAYEIMYDGAGKLKEQDSRYGSGTGETGCTIKETPDDLYSENYLVCVDKKTRSTSKYYPIHAAVKSGSRRNFKGIQVVTMGMAGAVTTTSVKIRQTPSVTGKALSYSVNPYDSALPSVPEKTAVTVIARTMTKEKVQNWENYWYLVNVGIFNLEVWMFGEFVRMK